MHVNKYVPFAIIYFFINSLALPFGLTYTSLMAPFFYIWILVIQEKGNGPAFHCDPAAFYYYSYRGRGV